jgi:hypothetical protein
VQVLREDLGVFIERAILNAALGDLVNELVVLDAAEQELELKREAGG